MNNNTEKTIVCLLFGLGILLRHAFSAETVLFVPFSCILSICAFTDLEKRIIPGAALKAGVMYRAAAVAMMGNVSADILDAALGAAALIAVLLPVILIYEKARGRSSIGGGDIKLLVLSGAYLGVWNGLTALLAACICALASGAVYIKHRRLFPWGPAIAVGVFIGMMAG